MRGTGYADHAGFLSPVYMKDAVHSAALGLAIVWP